MSITEEFRFAYPWVFLIFVPAIFFLLNWLRGQWRGTPAVMRYSDTRLLSGLTRGARVRLRRLPDVLRVLAWILLVVALARPQGGESREIIRGEGIDIVLAIDISESMLANDFDPFTRIEAAKTVMQDFVQGRIFDRIGLVVFAQEAYHYVPPTTDYSLLLAAIGEIRSAVELGLPNRTSIGTGIASAVNMLRDSEVESQVVILLTDGEHNAGVVDPLSAARAAQVFEVRLYTIGMGFPGVQGGELDEETLVAIAGISNGRYFNALDLGDLQGIYAEIDQLERSEIERELFTEWQDQAFWLLPPILLLLILERILRHTFFQTIP